MKPVSIQGSKRLYSDHWAYDCEHTVKHQKLKTAKAGYPRLPILTLDTIKENVKCLRCAIYNNTSVKFMGQRLGGAYNQLTATFHRASRQRPRSMTDHRF